MKLLKRYLGSGLSSSVTDYAVKLVKDVKAGKIPPCPMILFEHHRVLMILIDGLPLLLSNTNRTTYRP